MRDGEREVRDLVAGRERDERAISLATPYYDVVRQKHGESDEEAEEASEVAVDYLTQFLPLVTGTRSLNRPEALEVRERSLKVSPAVSDLVGKANWTPSPQPPAYLNKSSSVASPTGHCWHTVCALPLHSCIYLMRSPFPCVHVAPMACLCLCVSPNASVCEHVQQLTFCKELSHRITVLTASIVI